MTIQEKQRQIEEDFALFDDWNQKYEYIIDLGKRLPPMPNDEKQEQFLIKGCQSKVWLTAHLNEKEEVVFHAGSDAIIVKGLISMLVDVYSGQTPEVIVKTEPTFIDNIGMSQHLAQTRSNGLRAMVKQMKLYALAFKTQKTASQE